MVAAASAKVLGQDWGWCVEAQNRARVAGTEFTSHSFSLSDTGSVTLSEVLREAWHGQGAKLSILTGESCISDSADERNVSP